MAKPFISKDKTKPYFGKEVTIDSSGRVVEAGISNDSPPPTPAPNPSPNPNPFNLPPPPDVYGTSSAEWGQVSPEGVVEIPPLNQPLDPNGTSPRINAIPSTAAQVMIPPSPITQMTPQQEFEFKMSNPSVDPAYYNAHSGSASVVTSTDLALIGSVPSAFALKLIAPTAVTVAARIGTSSFAALKNVGLDLAANNAGKAATTGAFKTLGLSIGAASLLVGLIGSYPFAGFIKEEALQTLGYGVSTALTNNNIAGAEDAIHMQKEVLNPTVWDQILGATPFVNVLNNLKDFYEASKVKLAIDEQIVKDKKTQAETGETDAQLKDRLQREQDQRYKDNIDYYNEQRKLMLQWEEQAADQDMKDDAAYWAAQRKKQRELEEKDRQAIADFWLEYRKRMQQISDDSRPSQLNFGLI
jgi:hypothetical protein